MDAQREITPTRSVSEQFEALRQKSESLDKMSTGQLWQYTQEWAKILLEVIKPDSKLTDDQKKDASVFYQQAINEQMKLIKAAVGQSYIQMPDARA